MPARDLFIHLLRTVVLCVLLAVFFLALVTASVLWGLSFPILAGLLAVAVAAVIVGTAHWHPYWAPIAKQAARIPWQRSNGVQMETVVEIAIVQSGALTRTEIYRVSIYEHQSKKRLKRVMIGDDANFLGAFRSKLWFYIYDRFYARRDGLVCLHMYTGEWLYHKPQSELEFVRRVGKRQGVIEVLHRGVKKQIDLSTEPMVAP